MEQITIIKNETCSVRIELGILRITEALQHAGYTVAEEKMPENFEDYRNIPGKKLYAGVQKQDRFLQWLEENEILIFHTKEPEEEGFYIESCPARLTVVSGGSETGALYGCMELKERVERMGEMPAEITFGDAPVFKLRGPAVGLQKTKVEAPRLTYEYPITPGRFPWFYDREMWTKFMDMLLDMRCNVLYIWSGHPFSSLVKVPDYPEALEVTEEEFQQNRELFGWLTKECDRRGIWVVLKFYNIHIPLPFARAHGLELLQSNISPLVADYTRQSIREFIKSFPHIGLMVCLGEALRGTQNKTDWFIDTIIPGVKDGGREAGLAEEPPIILRGHDCDPIGAMEEAKKKYTNLYTMWKYNGESLTTYYPKGNWQKIHQSLSGLGTTHIMNIHILADLEPFQFNAPLYIQKCVQAGQNRYGCNGLHLYPLFYWDWPYTPDKVSPRLLQMDRDHIWFAAWFRYAWNPDREENTEREYWENVFARHYGISRESAEKLLAAQENAAQCAPKLLGRVGITEGNRQTLSLGMSMSQFTNVTRFRPNRELWESVARKGEQPDDYMKKEVNREPHLGETPYDCVEEVSAHAKKALALCEAVIKAEGEDREELNRLYTDAQAVYSMTISYCRKIEAAMEILRYKYTMDEKCRGDITFLEKAEQKMAESLEEYKKLAALTQETYLYANSMQTPQRKIPFPNGETYGHWTACLPEYRKELEHFRAHLAELQQGILPTDQAKEVTVEPLKPAPYTLLKSESCETYELKKGESVFSDCSCKIINLAPELANLTGVRMGLGAAIEEGVTVKLELPQDSYVLVGYMNAKGVEWLQLPDLETNTHADDRAGLTVVYANAMKAEACPPINIHAYRYEKGTHEIYFGTGAFLIAGVIASDTVMKPRNANLAGEGLETLDWLYEE
ncbi:hypothetical protein K040078D81_02010 [Blautia hominis]|uniref:Beta-hexosaminidase bacterial type N-terminal domain-containing protein n=1 Tax=Blautia hominis TaxID=2025493 RepID=A0ABQ0B3Q9_9FIRM